METPRTAADGLLDRARFEAFYDRALPVVYGYLWRRSGRRHDIAMELTQETFLGAVRALRSGVRVDEPLPWIMALARRRLIDHYRRNRVRESKRPAVETPDPGSGETSQSEARLVSSLGSLPAQYRLVLVLRYVDDWPVAQIAEVLNKSVAATESQLARARSALADSYERQSGE